MVQYAVYVRMPWAGDDFTVGITQPSSTNTGVPAGTTLATLSGDQTITTAGTVIENKRIEGRVLVQTSGVVLRNCEIVGTTAILENAATTVVGLVECFGTGRSVTLERCTLRPQQPSPCIDGVRGWNITATRCDISCVTDGFGIIPPSGSLNSGVTVRGCYVHHHSFFTQSGWRAQIGSSTALVHPSDTSTHNDGIQIHGGSSTLLEGNFFCANSAYSLGVGQSPNAADRVNVGVQLDVAGSLGPINSTSIQYNWFDYGYAGQIQAAPAEAIASTVITGNRFTSNNSSSIEIRMNSLGWSGSGNTLDGTGTPRSN